MTRQTTLRRAFSQNRSATNPIIQSCVHDVFASLRLLFLDLQHQKSRLRRTPRATCDRLSALMLRIATWFLHFQSLFSAQIITVGLVVYKVTDEAPGTTVSARLQCSWTSVPRYDHILGNISVSHQAVTHVFGSMHSVNWIPFTA